MNVDEIISKVQDVVTFKCYELQHFDFGEFPPEDERHFERFKEDYIERNQVPRRELTAKKIIEYAVKETLRLTKTNKCSGEE